MKLNANDIKEIRSAFRKAENAAEARVALANRYGITPAQVDSITEGVERDQHHRPNSKAFDVELFKELYYGDPEEFTFVPNIISVDYYDGITVGNHFGITDYYDENGQIHFAED